jgi:hypothetical protein
MKQILTLTILLMCITSCKKDLVITEQRKSGYLENVKSLLKDSLDKTSFEALDFSKAIKTRISDDTNFLRIPFKGTIIQKQFLLLQTDKHGQIGRGRAVAFDQSSYASERMTKYRPYNGHIVIKNLKGKKILESEIENGYIVALHRKRKNHRVGIVPVEPYYSELPEVIVVAQHTQESGINFSDWFSFSGIFNDTYTPYNSYVSMDGYGGGGEYNDYGYNYSITPARPGEEQQLYTYEEPAIVVDYEQGFDDPAIELNQYLKCFNNIPDAGATCSIEIFADIPVDSDPNKLLNWETGSPGHTFLRITKSNGGQYVSQNIGFYPESGWKASLTNAPVAGKFVDNAGHEFNASLRMNISPTQLQAALFEMQRLARNRQYDIDEYNCSDFALDVFNAARSQPLEIPMYHIPGGMTAGGTRTPQGLYNKLKAMRNAGDPESNNITVDIYKAWAGGSNGPCN